MFRLLPVYIFLFAFSPLFTAAQALTSDTPASHAISISHPKNKLYRLLPDHGKLQFAGGIGFLSVAIGYESGGRRLEYDIYYGYVPEKFGGTAIHSLTGKLTWIALNHDPVRHIQWDILSVGILFNYVFGKQYFLFSPRNYPYDYYGFPTAAHLGLFTGGGIRYKKIGLYYEIGTTDKEVISYIGNSQSLKLTDIINIGIGARFSFK